MNEPFGYFRPTPFGWEDCAPDDEGARPLYEYEDVQRAVQAERETCAKVCLELAHNWRGDPVLAGMSDGAEDCAAAIRERSNE